jgi:hypothetical protein
MPVRIDTPVRVLFDTTVLWGAFHGPTGPNFTLLALAAQRLPMLDGFITDAVGAEFWWRATQQGIKMPGLRSTRTYTEAELTPFLEAFAVLFEPEDMARAPMSRTLGRYAAMVGMPLGEALAAITGKDRDALLAGVTTAVPMTDASPIAGRPRAGARSDGCQPQSARAVRRSFPGAERRRQAAR